jgi:hypothetical protein
MRTPFTLLAALSLACKPDADLQPDDTALPAPGLPDEARLLGHVEELSSATYAGREPGSEGGALAEAYLEEQLGALGLEGAGDDGFRQHFPLQRYTVTGPAALQIDGTTYSQGDDFQLFTYAGAGDVADELVFVGYGLTVPPFDVDDYPSCPLDPAGYDDYQGMQLEGRVALVLRHGPNDDWDISDHCPVSEAGLSDGDLYSFGYKASNAAVHGAAAMLLFTDYQHSEGGAEQGTISESYYQPDFPALYVARDLLESHLPELEAWSTGLDASLEPAPHATGVQVDLSTQTEVSTVSVPNIIARIPGADPALAAEAVLVGAHFDHLGTGGGGEIYYGADDNASGSAVVLELARLFTEWGVRPARTVIFALFNAEELGLIGSMYYVIEPPHPIDETVAMINLDMVGGGDELGLIDFGGLEDGSEELYELLVSQQNDDFPVTPLEGSANSDHAWFQYSGVPVAFLFSVGAHAQYHSPQDTFDLISGLELYETARISWDVLRILAMGEEGQVRAAAKAQPQRPVAPSIDPELLPPMGGPLLR